MMMMMTTTMVMMVMMGMILMKVMLMIYIDSELGLLRGWSFGMEWSPIGSPVTS